MKQMKYENKNGYNNINKLSLTIAKQRRLVVGKKYE